MKNAIKLSDKDTSLKGQYVIVALCDPYHARSHRNGGDVIRRNGATPVEWVANDGHGYGYTKEEAINTLAMWAAAHGENEWMDEDSAKEFAQMIAEDNDEEYNGEIPEWYKGEGAYVNGVMVYESGCSEYSEDVMVYRVECADDVMVELD